MVGKLARHAVAYKQQQGMTMTVHPVLIAGRWQASEGVEHFAAVNPATGERLADRYPVSPFSELEKCLRAADEAARVVRRWPGERFARFLEVFADKVDARSAALVEAAHRETGLPVAPRLKDAELPRTTNQMRQSAQAARDGSWAMPTIDVAAKIGSVLEPIGPVAVFGPNNFPYAYNGAAGGDFAAAVAAGNPVIAKGHPLHPTTTRLLAEAGHEAAEETGMPPGFYQLFYHCSNVDGASFVSHPALGAIGYTGSRAAGTYLKILADAVGKPFYAELSSINPVFVLPGAVQQHRDAFVEQFVSSCLMACGQFCTNPGLVIALASRETDEMIAAVAAKFASSPVGVLLGEGVLRSLKSAVETLSHHGAQILTGGSPVEGPGYRFQNTLLRVTGHEFLRHYRLLQTEAFGNSSLVVVVDSNEQMLAVCDHLEGNLTGSIYSATDGQDESLYAQLEDRLRPKVGRLLNDKMPTGVAVVPSMNHGGPFPATGHPGFTAVGVPATLRRFGRLACYDAVRPERLPSSLRDKSPNGTMWRMINGQLMQGDVPA